VRKEERPLPAEGRLALTTKTKTYPSEGGLL
jgi:hypothetical protein